MNWAGPCRGTQCVTFCFLFHDRGVSGSHFSVGPELCESSPQRSELAGRGAKSSPLPESDRVTFLGSP